MKTTLLILALFIVFFSSFARAERMTFKNLTPEMGLSHGDVNCFYQDHEGFMWIGTVDGLNKYDGVSFTVYKYDQKDTNSLPNSCIIGIYEDTKNNLWIGTATTDGLCRYKRETDSFERIRYTDGQNRKVENIVTTLFEDNSGKLWMCTSNGVYWFDTENNITHPCFTDVFGMEILVNFNEIHQDKHGVLWFISEDQTYGGIIKYNPATNETERYNTQHPIFKLQENAVYSFLIDKQDNIWIGGYSSGLSMINQQTKKITNFRKELSTNLSFNNQYFPTLAQTDDGIILIGTEDGLSVFDPDKKQIIGHYTANGSNVSILSNSIKSIFIGDDGIVWLGCWAGGVSVYDKRLEKFTLYRNDEQTGYTFNAVTDFAEDLSGNIWVASDGKGITWFNPIEKKFVRYQSNSSDPFTLTNDKVLAVETDSQDGLWAGMWQGGLNYFQIEGNKLILKKKYPFVDETDPKSNSVFKIYRNKAGEIWVGNFETGAYLFDPKTERFKLMFSLKDIAGELKANSAIVDILSDSYGNVWLATLGRGLIRLNPENGKYEHFTHDDNDSTSISSNGINVLFEDSEKRLWVGSSGLSLFNRETNRFTHYTTDQGLPDNTVVGILEDNQHNLWISTNNGISKATVTPGKDKVVLTFRNFSTIDGLQDKIFNKWAFSKSRNCEMYFGGNRGFNVFCPDSIKDNPYLPPVHITDFLLFNKPVTIGAKDSPLQKQISQTQEIVLKHAQSMFTFRFVALNYIFSEKNQYAYKMEGFDKDWNYVGNRREATYTNLDPGEYTFRVKASNNDGVWNEKGTSIKIVILPPWWLTWWFKSIAGVLILGCILGFYFYRVGTLKKQKKQLEELVELRTLEIQEKNDELLQHSEELSQMNTVLIENQQRIEKQDIALQEANEAKDKFFSIIAHDLRSPFNSFLGLTQLLAENLSRFTMDELQELSMDMKKSATNLLRLLENLLQWARFQQGSIPFNPEPLNLLQQVEVCIAMVIGQANNKKIELSYHIPDSLIVYADSNILQTTIRNMITNAIKFTPRGGKIHLSAKPVNESFLEISIQDTGVGMTKEMVNNLFRLDVKTNREGTDGEPSTGLGLLLCKEFIEKHGGKIWVESELGKGTIFTFSIPLTKPKA